MARPTRNIIGQRKPKFSLQKVMEHNQVLIGNFAGIRKQEARLLVNLMLTKLYLVAANIPLHQRREIYLYVDEVGSVAGYIVQILLSESAKLGFRLTFANQYLAQLGE